MIIKKFNQMDESLRDQMTPKTDEQMLKAIEGKPPHFKLARLKVLGIEDKEVINKVKQEIEEENNKLKQIANKYNKNSLKEFVEVVGEWIKENGGRNVLSYDLNTIANGLSNGFSNRGYYKYETVLHLKYGKVFEDIQEEEEEEDYPKGKEKKGEPSFFRNTTVDFFMKFVINYAIDQTLNDNRGDEPVESSYANYDYEDEEYYEEEMGRDEDDMEEEMDIEDDLEDDEIEVETADRPTPEQPETRNRIRRFFNR